MKQPKSKKLSLKKVTVTNLDRDSMSEVKGGVNGSSASVSGKDPRQPRMFIASASGKGPC